MDATAQWVQTGVSENLEIGCSSDRIVRTNWSGDHFLGGSYTQCATTEASEMFMS